MLTKAWTQKTLHLELYCITRRDWTSKLTCISKHMACIFVGKYKPIHTHEYPHSLWRHQMETFSALLALCAGNSHKSQWRGALMFSLICASINSWVNNREAGGLKRHRAHYDVIVMWERYQLCSDVNGHKRVSLTRFHIPSVPQQGFS